MDTCESGETHDRLLKLLCNVEFRLMEVVLYLIKHVSAQTSEEIALIRGTPLETGAKAMLIKTDDLFCLIVISANLKFNSKQAKKFLNTKNLRFADKDELRNITGCLNGAVPPFGSLFSVKTYVDSQLIKIDKYDYISFNAGLRTKSIILSKKNYLELEQPIIADLC